MKIRCFTYLSKKEKEMADMLKKSKKMRRRKKSLSGNT